MNISFELCSGIIQNGLVREGHDFFINIFSGAHSPLFIPFGSAALGMIAVAFLCQAVAFRHLPVDSQGAAEYAHRESIILSTAEGIISKSKDQVGSAGFALKWLEIYNHIKRQAELEHSSERQFTLYMAAVEVANRVDDARRAIDTLKHAILLKPTDLIANFWLARAFERLGSAKQAIEAYKTALMDPSITSERLKDFLACHVQRVRMNGPDRGPALSTFRYEMW